MRIFHITLFLTLNSLFVFSQSFQAESMKDTLLLINGNVLITKVIDTTNGVTVVVNPKKTEKRLIIDNDKIFSIKRDTSETIMYVYDSVPGDEFTVDEMRYFIRGEQDAQKGFKAKGSLYGNMALSAGAGVTGSFLCPIVPFVFAALVGIPKVKIKKSSVRDLNDLNSASYLMGYQRVARKKRKINSLIGGGAGLIVGLSTFGVLKATNNEIW